jgi:hypothetical protein
MTLLVKPPPLPSVPLQQRATNNHGDQEDEIMAMITMMAMTLSLKNTGRRHEHQHAFTSIHRSFIQRPQVDGKKNRRLVLQLSPALPILATRATVKSMQ